MSAQPYPPPARPRRWWLAALVGAAPHLAVLAHFSWPRDAYYAVWEQGQQTQLPFLWYGTSELYIVPGTLVAVLAVAAAPCTRPWALWLLLGTLAGATAMLLNLTIAAHTWR